MKNKIILAAVISAAVVLVNRAADVSYYLITKGQEQKQTNTAAIITQTNESPFRFLSIVSGSTTDAVNSASLKLPSAQVRTLTNTDGSFQQQQGFSTKTGLDGAYAAGNYQFTIGAVNDGTNRPTLPLATDAYPSTPVIANWADLQAVEPELPLYISWNTFSNGTPNDFALLELDELDGTPVVATPDLLQPDAMNGTNLVALVAAGTMDYGTSYEGRILFMKRTALATTNYPGASGLAGYFRQTIFPVTTLPAPPVHGRLQFSASSSSIREDAGAAQLTVTRAGTEGGVSVDVFTSDGTTTAGADYETLSETLHFEDGEQFKTVPITVLDDFLLEGNETVNVHLANATDGAELGQRTNLVLTILDNEIAAAGKLQFSATNFNASEASNQVSIIVNRVGGSTGIVTASYATEDGTALGLGVDYGTSIGTLVFSNGVTTRTLIIPVVNDALDETNEIFRVKLTATSGGAALGTNLNSTVTILDNDAGGAFSFKPAILATNENAGGFLVTVVRTSGTASGVTVDYATHNGTAHDGDDYTETEGTLTFGSNVLSQTIFVPVLNDVLPNGNRIFTLTLTNATGGATISTTNTATLTILDDESSVSFTNSGFTVSEASSNLVVNVLRTGALGSSVSVAFATVDDSAIAGTDYFATNGVLTFTTNTSLRSFTVRLKNNTLVDESRQFRLQLSNPLNGLLLGAVTDISVTITNEDRGGAIRFSTNSYTVSETATNARITLLRTGGIASGVTVKFKLEDGSAEAGLDYSNVTQVVTFNAGETNKQILVPVINDTLVENPETVLLSLEDVDGGASLGSPIAATLTITSDDVGGVISFFRTNFFAYENATNMYVIVNRTGGKASGVSVHYATDSGTATSGADFAETEGDLTFAANETNKLITIPIVNDTIAEGNESFSISLSDVSGGASLGTVSNAVLGIIDDESSISIGNSNYAVTEGVTNLAITFYRGGSLVTPVSVDFATVDGSATAPGDYIVTNGTLSFPTNVVSKTILIRIVNDTLVEENEFFNLHIFNPQGGVQLSTGVTNTEISITDNDLGGAIRFATNGYSVSEAGTNARITLVRTGGIASGVTVKFKTEDGPAESGLDYSNATQVVTFIAGETNKQILVPIINDTIVENPETVLLSLEDATGGASVGSIANATLTITSDDVGGVISFSRTNYSAFENGANLFVTVNRTIGKASAVSVHYTTHSGTATSGDDFAETEGDLNFAANETNKLITIPIVNDTIAEGNETFTISLANVAGGASLGTISNAVLTIIDDESSIRIGSNSYAISEGVTNLSVTFFRDGALLTPVSVDFATVDGSATAPGDYVATNGTLTFPTNVLSKTIIVRLINDTLVEENEFFNLHLSNPQGGVQLSTGVTNAEISITDNDLGGAIRFSTNGYSVSEAGTNARITLIRTGGIASGVTVKFKTEDGSAESGLDYSNATQVVTFIAGETNKVILVSIINDTIVENPETILLSLEDATGGASVGSIANATLTILDNDLGGVISLASAAQSANENSTNFLVTVKRTSGAASGVTVNYATASGTATQDSDFTDTHGTLTFGAGETNKTILIPIINDTLPEGSENFSLTLANAGGGATLGAIPGTTLTIIDDESSISLASATVSISEAGTNLIITLIRSGASNTLVSVDFATVNGTAIGGSDFGATNGTVTFAANVGGSKTIIIPILNDSFIENAESFSFRLSNPQGGVQLGSITNETVTILNDDFAGTVNFSATSFNGVEGSNAVVTLTRTGGLASGVSVYFQMAAGTAFPGTDYTNKTGYISFAAGQTTTNILVPIITDSLTEATETVFMTLSNPLGGLQVGAPSFATLNIADKPDPNAVPEAGAVFFTVSVNGTPVTGLTLTSPSFSDLSGLGANSLLSFTFTKTTGLGTLSQTTTSFLFQNIVANGTGILTYPGSSSANGLASYSLTSLTTHIYSVTGVTGASGTITLDVLNKTSKTATGRFDLNTVDQFGSGTYHLVGSFRVRWP